MADGTIIYDTEINGNGAKKGINELKAEAEKLAREYQKAGMSSSKAWAKAWSEVKRNSRSGSNEVKSSMQGISSIAKKCATVVGGLFVLDKIKDFTLEVAKTGISYNALNEQAQVAWTTILGSQDKANKMMSDIQKYAAATPFSKMGVDTMAKQLTNAGFHGQALFDQLTKIGDMGSAFGIQEDSLKEMVRQYAQVQQAQVAYTEDLNILQDRGIPIYKALGQVMGVPISQVKQLASQGKVTADVYNKAIDSIASKTKGAMDAQSKTFNGMLSTIQDNLEMLAGSIMKPTFDLAKQGLGIFADGLDFVNGKIAETGSVSGALGAIITSAFGGATGAVNPFGYAINNGQRALQRLSQAAANEAMPIFDSFKSVLSNLGEIVKPVGETFVFLGNVVFVTLCDTTSTVIQIFSQLAQTLSNVVGSIASTIAPALQDLFGSVQDYFDQAANILLGTILPALQDLANKVIETFNTYIVPAVSNAAQFISQNVIPLLTSAFDWLTDSVLPKLEAIFKAVWPSIENAVTRSVKTIGIVLQGLISVIKFLWPIVSGLFTVFKTVFDGILSVTAPILPVLTSGFLNLASVIGGFVIAFKTMMVINKIITGIKLLKQSMIILKAQTVLQTLAQWGLNASLLACPITWIVIAIGALVGAFIYLWNTSEGFRNFWVGLWNIIKNACVTAFNSVISFFTDTIPKAFSSIINFFKSDWKEILLFIVNPFAGAFALAYKHCEGFRNFIDNLVTNVKMFFVNGFNNMKQSVVDFATNALTTIQTWGTNVWNFFVVTIPNWISSIFNWFSELPYKIGYALGFVIGKIILWGVGVWNYLVTNIPIWINSIGNWFAELPGRIWTWLVATITKIGIWGSQMLSKATTIASQFISNCITYICQLPGRIWTWLVNTVSKVASWGSQMWSKATTIASQFVSKVITYICQLPGRIWTWLVNTVSRVANWGSQMWSKATTIASQFVSKVITYICQLPSKIWTWLVNALNKVGQWGSSLFSRGAAAARQLVSAVVETVSSIPGKMLDIGRRIVEGVWNGITGAAGWFKDQVHNFFSGIVDGAKDALGIHSPARKMIPVGKYTVEGAEVGMKKQMPKLQSNMREKIANLTKGLREKVNAEAQYLGANIISKSNLEINAKVPEQITTNNDNGIQQTFVFNKEVDSPSDIARKVKQIGRDIVFG